jgi:UDP-N-acetylmuramoylalanine--D-glutamate ligase
VLAANLYQGQSVALLGLGETGLSAAKALKTGGADVLAWDENLQNRERAIAEDIQVEDLTQFDWGELSALIVENGDWLNAKRPNRLIELAHAVDIPVPIASCVLVDHVRAQEAFQTIIVTGQHAAACAEIILSMLAFQGLHARCLLDNDLGRESAKIIICPMEELDIVALSPDLSIDALIALRPLNEKSVDEASIQQIASKAKRAVIASVQSPSRLKLVMGKNDGISFGISDRMVISRGVYAAGLEYFEALGHRAQRIGTLDPIWPKEAVLAAIGLALKFDVSVDNIRLALESWSGAPGFGKLIFHSGEISVFDWSFAQTSEDALTILGGDIEVFWIAGPNVDPGIADELRRDPRAVKKIYLANDRSRAEPRLSRYIETAKFKNLSAAFARAMYDAAQVDEPVHIVYAPACQIDPLAKNAFERVMQTLFLQAVEDDVA